MKEKQLHGQPIIVGHPIMRDDSNAGTGFRKILILIMILFIPAAIETSIRGRMTQFVQKEKLIYINGDTLMDPHPIFPAVSIGEIVDGDTFDVEVYSMRLDDRLDTAKRAFRVRCHGYNAPDKQPGKARAKKVLAGLLSRGQVWIRPIGKRSLERAVADVYIVVPLVDSDGHPVLDDNNKPMRRTIDLPATMTAAGDQVPWGQ